MSKNALKPQRPEPDPRPPVTAADVQSTLYWVAWVAKMAASNTEDKRDDEVVAEILDILQEDGTADIIARFINIVRKRRGVQPKE